VKVLAFFTAPQSADPARIISFSQSVAAVCLFLPPSLKFDGSTRLSSENLSLLTTFGSIASGYSKTELTGLALPADTGYPCPLVNCSDDDEDEDMLFNDCQAWMLSVDRGCPG